MATAESLQREEPAIFATIETTVEIVDAELITAGNGEMPLFVHGRLVTTGPAIPVVKCRCHHNGSFSSVDSVGDEIGRSSGTSTDAFGSLCDDEKAVGHPLIVRPFVKHHCS